MAQAPYSSGRRSFIALVQNVGETHQSLLGGQETSVRNNQGKAQKPIDMTVPQGALQRDNQGHFRRSGVSINSHNWC